MVEILLIIYGVSVIIASAIAFFLDTSYDEYYPKQDLFYNNLICTLVPVINTWYIFDCIYYGIKKED